MNIHRPTAGGVMTNESVETSKATRSIRTLGSVDFGAVLVGKDGVHWPDLALVTAP